MKTIFRDKVKVKCYTISDLAVALDMTASTLWQAIYISGDFPKPKRVKGQRRLYYSEDVFDEIVSAFKAT